MLLLLLLLNYYYCYHSHLPVLECPLGLAERLFKLSLKTFFSLSAILDVFYLHFFSFLQSKNLMSMFIHVLCLKS